jgi:2-polyprenyl-6-methoxyphenol hydroxylase-like FAD-dependent oxidoreductase
MGTDRILIAGAGPTGLTAALELARRGYAPRIVDRDEGPTPLSKAVGISPRSLDILEPSGVTERLLARGIRMQRVQARYRGEVLATIGLAQLPHRFNFLLALPQSETEAAMAEALAGYEVKVEWRTELAGLSEAGGELEAELKGPRGGSRRTRFDVVFGADGAHSRVREAMDLGFEGYTHRRTWSIADVEAPGWPYPDATAQAVLHRNGDIGFAIPIGPDRYRIVSNTPDARARLPGAEAARVLRTDTFALPIRQARSYQRGGAFLGGDAAHVHSPVGARGMNLGIEDAAGFARRLAEGTLDGYTAERRPIGRRWIALSERLLAAVQADSWAGVTARNLAIRVAGRLPILQRQGLERVAGLRE